jgi:hypothetical protein
MHQDTHAEGRTVTITPALGAVETHVFASAEEATARAAFVAEALSWIGTPFVDCADVKGPDGAVDCAMLLTRCAVDSGLVAPFDPRPYPPRHMLHHEEQHFLAWVTGTLGCVEVESPRPGDVAVYWFGRCFSHGAVLINAHEVVHAWAHERMVNATLRTTPGLVEMPFRGRTIPRPVRYFDPYRGRV